MDQLESWIEQIEMWYRHRKHDQGSDLERLLQQAPQEIWGPTISDRQSKAMACWLDGCLRVFQHERYQAPTKAYQYLQFASSKLEQVAANPVSELKLRDWCIKRLQHLMVLSVEFCNQQPQARWQTESYQLIEAHIHFMAAQCWNEARNDDQGNVSFH